MALFACLIDICHVPWDHLYRDHNNLHNSSQISLQADNFSANYLLCRGVVFLNILRNALLSNSLSDLSLSLVIFFFQLKHNVKLLPN